MPDSEHPDPEDLSTTTDQGDAVDDAEAGEEEPQKLDLAVKVDRRSTCERHITVTVPRADIDRYFDKEFSELMPSAQVAGFRPGHAPRKLVEKQFRKGIADKVKSTLLMDSLTQVNEDQDLSAISEPDIDLDAVELHDDGPLTFEFDLEVRPEFDLPKWKGLKIEKPVREFTADDVDRALQNLLANRGRLIPFDGPPSRATTSPSTSRSSRASKSSPARPKK
jgi:trigger factor